MNAEYEIPNIELNTVKLGLRVKEARKAVKMTQEELAGICDCTTTHLSNIEKGKIGVSLLLLFRISVATNKTLDYFVMDNPHVDTAIKINSELAPILLECDQDMLDMVSDFVQRLLDYRKKLDKAGVDSK